MDVQIPDTRASRTVTDWTDDVDVVVVGLGIAGGAAALEAARAGARVLVLERAAVAGGTSAMAGGHFYLGGGTAVQQATGHADSPEQMAAYLTQVAKDPEPDKIAAYCADSVEHFTWLESLGFRFERSFYPHKAVIQPGTEGLMFTGNEQLKPFCDHAVPAPRGHKVPVPGDTGGASLVIDLLVAALTARGVTIRYETAARHLICDDDGAVVGVGSDHFGTTGSIQADGVILAAGGFVMNPAMVEAHVPRLGRKPYPLGSTYDDGLGIRLGASAGAGLRHMDECFLTAPIYPPANHLCGIVVNAAGRRFVNEASYHARTSASVMAQPDARAYLILDSEHVEKADFTLVPFVDGYATIAELAAALDLPADALAATLDRYNDFAGRAVDPDFGKQPQYLHPQTRGPWAVFDLSLGAASYAGFTLGGLATSVDAEVLTEAGAPIPGLYAAGACAPTLAQDGLGYASGLQLGAGSYFGRRAGRHAVRVAGVCAIDLNHNLEVEHS